MKIAIITGLLFLAMNHSQSQTVYPPENNTSENIDLSDDQIAGYTLVGLGTVAIAYTAFKISNEKNPTAIYIGGGVLIAGGLCFLIFGEKGSKTKYWKGVKASLPYDNLNKNLLSLPCYSTYSYKSSMEQGYFQITRF